jgi:hypothetical protein
MTEAEEAEEAVPVPVQQIGKAKAKAKAEAKAKAKAKAKVLGTREARKTWYSGAKCKRQLKATTSCSLWCRPWSSMGQFTDTWLREHFECWSYGCK